MNRLIVVSHKSPARRHLFGIAAPVLYFSTLIASKFPTLTPKVFFQHIRSLIAKDDLNSALTQLQKYLQHTPVLNDVLQQAGRFANIQKQIALGTVSHKEASLTTNKIRIGLLELLTELEGITEQSDLKPEAQQAVSTIQTAEKIYNIDHIDNANFS